MQNRSYDREESVEHLEGPDPVGSGSFVSPPAEARLRQLVHDTANWYSAMLGQIDLLRPEVAGDATARLAALRRAVEACDALGRQALEGGPSDESEPAGGTGCCELEQSVADALEVVRVRAGASSTSIEWRHELPPGLEAAIDASRLTNALVNLLENSRRALAERGGRVVVRAERDADRVVVEVIDDGPGMDADTLRQCLDVGFTTREGGASADQGLPRGRGLAGAVEAMRSAGGSLDIESAPGKGTRVRLSLPIVPSGSSVEGHGRPAVVSSRSLVGRILIVEDDPAVAEVMTEMVVVLGHGARAVDEARRVEGALAEASCDVMIVDQNLPDRMGVELANDIRQAHPAVAIVLLTGDLRAAERLARDPSIDLVATKPLGLEDLRELLQRALQISHDRRSSPRRGQASA